MGRRRSSWGANHARTGNTKTIVHADEKTATVYYDVECRDSYVSAGSANPEKAVTCGNCLAILAKRNLKASTGLRFGEPIRDKAWLGYHLRSIQTLYFEDKLIGFAVTENGWGKGWYIRRVTGDGCMGANIGKLYGATSYGSKEEALLAVPQLVADGKLFTQDEVEEAVKRSRAAAERERVEREAKAEADRAERERRYEILVRVAQKCHGEERTILDKACRAYFHKGLPKELVP